MKFSAFLRLSMLRVRAAPRLNMPLDEFPNVKAWVERIEARPAVQRGINVPSK